ncbi:MAG: hypothetical protein ACRDSH_02760, partial [Pseudonocardiaceae bacterium]
MSTLRGRRRIALVAAVVTVIAALSAGMLILTRSAPSRAARTEPGPSTSAAPQSPASPPRGGNAPPGGTAGNGPPSALGIPKLPSTPG